MPQAITNALRQGQELSDPTFDRIYPLKYRFRSWLHWTPLDVATRVAELLASRGATRVLDIGAGPGKVCLVGALTTTAMWFGIERDAEMVQVARAAAEKLNVPDRAIFLHGDATRIDWSTFDAFYLFNPFGEYLLASQLGTFGGRELYLSYVESTQQRLAEAPVGTCVVTYHGFGAEMPAGYAMVHREQAHEDELVMWVQRATQERPW